MRFAIFPIAPLATIYSLSAGLHQGLDNDDDEEKSCVQAHLHNALSKKEL